MPIKGKTLFVSAVICFLKSKYRQTNYTFDDNFQNDYSPECLIYNDKELIFVEIKSEKESYKTRTDYTNKTFKNLRQKIKPLPGPARNRQWILYIAQLWDYAKNNCVTKDSPNINNPKLLFAFPYKYFLEVIEALKLLCKNIGLSLPKFEVIKDDNKHIKVMIFAKTDLDRIFKKLQSKTLA